MARKFTECVCWCCSVSRSSAGARNELVYKDACKNEELRLAQSSETKHEEARTQEMRNRRETDRAEVPDVSNASRAVPRRRVSAPGGTHTGPSR